MTSKIEIWSNLGYFKSSGVNSQFALKSLVFGKIMLDYYSALILSAYLKLTQKPCQIILIFCIIS